MTTDDRGQPPPTAAEEALVLSALHTLPPRAASLVRRYGKVVEFDDLCSVGTVALYKAARGYLPVYNRSFEDYGGYLAWAAMLDHARRLATYDRRKNAVRKVVMQFVAFDEEDDQNRAWRYTDEQSRARSDAFAAGVAGAAFTAAIMDAARGEPEEDPEWQIDRDRALDLLKAGMSGLRPKELQTVELVFGKLMSLEEAAEVMQVSVKSVWRWQKAAQQKLRKGYEQTKARVRGGVKKK